MNNQFLSIAGLAMIAINLQSGIPSVQAADITWIGGTGLWNNAGNWSPAQLPGAGDNVFINNSGTYTVTLPDAVNATVGSLTLGGTSGTQTLSLGRSILTLNGASVVNPNGHLAMTVANSTVTGLGALTVDGTLNWAGGTMSGAAVTSISTNGAVNITGNATLTARTLNNAGVVTWNVGNITAGSGAVINNEAGGTFENTFDGRMNMATAPATFNNAGLFRKSGGTAALGTTTIDPQFINTGTVDVQTNVVRYAVNQQTAGLTLLDGGGLDVQGQPLNFVGGRLIGTGSITLANNQNVINSASISPGLPLGELDITGNYQQTASGVLNIDLGGYAPGTGFDLITVTAGGAGGVASLGGTLNVTLTNSFLPTNGATFTFLTAASRGGVFATFNYPSNDLGMQVSYDLASVTLKVTNLKPVVANPIADPAPVYYGDAFNFQFPANTFTDPDNDTLSYTAFEMPPGINFAGSTRTFAGTPTQAGVYPVTVVADDGGSPNLKATNVFHITVNPSTLTITADPQIKVYGASEPPLTYSVSGLKFTDTPATVLTGTLSRASGETVASSPYAITQGTLAANGSYTISFAGSTLVIAPVHLSVTADSKTKTYGVTDPTFTASYAGFVNGETASVLGGALNFIRAPGESVGSYLITPSGLTSGNYTITFNTGSLTIDKAGLTITADNKTKTYGATDPTFTASYAGFVNGETSSVLGGALSFTRALGENAGNYVITPSGLTSGNYTITFNIGSLAIDKVGLTITADNKTKTYGAADPTFTASYAGFVNGETASVLGGTLSFTRAPGENAGNYVITPSGLTTGNYTITFNTGSLTIDKVGLTITADSKTKTYGAADPTFTASYAGFVNGETAGVLGGTLSFTRAPGESVGNYVITPSGLTTGNYTITFITGSLTIDRTGLTITADSKTKTYGAADPTFTASYAGFVNGETASVLGGTLSFTRAPGENAGNYVITPSGLTSGNYTITFNTGTLTIDKAALSVTADNKTKTYGAADPTFTASYAGFVNGETASVLGGTLSFTRAPGENAGNYVITPNGLTSGNYTITFNSGTLTIIGGAEIKISNIAVIGAAQVSITWNSVSNVTYRVQFKDDLTTNLWTDLNGDILASGRTASKTDVINSSRRFYRVQLLH